MVAQCPSHSELAYQLLYISSNDATTKITSMQYLEHPQKLPFRSIQVFSPRTFSIMMFSVSSCYPASLVATFVL